MIDLLEAKQKEYEAELVKAQTEMLNLERKIQEVRQIALRLEGAITACQELAEEARTDGRIGAINEE